MKVRPTAIGALAMIATACSSERDEGPKTFNPPDATTVFDAAGTDGGAEAESGALEVTPAPEGQPWESLSEWNLFRDPGAQIPAERVIPYDVVSPLFSDYTIKLRFLWIPPGETIGYDPVETWRFPVGTILVKTFAYANDLRDPGAGRRLLETRLLVKEADTWAPMTYVWNDDQTEATRKVAGGTIPSTFIDASGATVENQYAVPNKNECFECHGEAGETNTLGGRTRQLDRDNDYGNGPENQIDHMTSLGFFETAPPAEERVRLTDPFGTAPLDDRVRSYLDANCGHCHDASGEGSTGSGLRLDWESTEPETDDPANWGVCKIPTSAGGATCGLTFDIVPGSPESSILYCRLASDETEIRMSPVGRNLIHTEGVELVAEWIRQMTGSCD